MSLVRPGRSDLRVPPGPRVRQVRRAPRARTESQVRQGLKERQARRDPPESPVPLGPKERQVRPALMVPRARMVPPVPPGLEGIQVRPALMVRRVRRVRRVRKEQLGLTELRVRKGARVT